MAIMGGIFADDHSSSYPVHLYTDFIKKISAQYLQLTFLYQEEVLNRAMAKAAQIKPSHCLLLSVS